MSSSSSTKVTITDVAEASNVSPATVSLVLRDKPGVGVKTRQRVLDTAQRLGYIHKPTVSQKKERAVKNIGLLVRVRMNDILAINDFYAPVLAGIEFVCRQQQANLIYANVPADDDNIPLEVPRLATSTQVDGLLLVGMQLNDTLTAVLQQQQLPAVLVDAYAPHNPYDAVLSDNFNGAYEATTHLIAKGHQHIAIVGSQPNAYPSVAARRAGYAAAIAEHNLTPHYINTPLVADAIVEPTGAYLRQHPEVTAVFACNDATAIAIMGIVGSIGREIPQTLSIIGFDNIPTAQHVTPPLTTMRIDKTGMGRLAAQHLFNRLEHPTSGQVRTVIRPNLIQRATIAAPTQ